MEFSQVKELSTNIFNIFNGNINVINNEINLHFVYNPQDVKNEGVMASFIYPNLIRVYYTCCKLNDSIASTIILNSIIHELYHADQYYLVNIKSDQVELDVEFMTYTFILNNERYLRSIISDLKIDLISSLLSYLPIKYPNMCPYYTRINPANYILNMTSCFMNHNDMKYISEVISNNVYKNILFCIKLEIDKDIIIISDFSNSSDIIYRLIKFAVKHMLNCSYSSYSYNIYYDEDNYFLGIEATSIKKYMNLVDK